ncbi:MAG: glycosyl hydrolase [Candidatus Eisenbacteria bacterium]|uniref:Glycosyl hydrolase n=1 Tax=Eiseniibacteriota bacterium TaxID=2212470 RepID=A0A956NGM8_UNCEI|nr:glycosyl hydrolase [Candidatus Eisenbacteria bacterium]
MIAAVLVNSGQHPEGAGLVDEEEESGQFLTGKKAGYLPNDWFHDQRSFPERDYAVAAPIAAMEQARADRIGVFGDRAFPADGPSSNGERGADTWSSVGPINIGGRLTAVGVHPSSPNRFYAGIAAGGVFRSDDAGASWEPIFDDTAVLSVGAIALGPTDPDEVWVGTGEANASGDSFAGDGVYRSTDGGDTWEHRGLEESEHIGRIVVDPTDPSRLYVAVLGSLWLPGPDRGVYRSTNAGLDWEQVLFVSDSTSVVDLAIDPSDPSRIYAAAWERLRGPSRRKVGGLTSGVYRTTDGGDSWTELTSGLPGGSNVGRIGLSVAASSPNIVYAIYADDPGYFMGLYRSTNSGTSWTQVNDAGLGDVFASYGWYFGNVQVSPTDPNDVYAYGYDLYRTTNAGGSWSQRWAGAHVDHHDFWIDPNNASRQILVGDGGVYLSSNDGGTWSHVETLPITQFYAGTVDPQNVNRIYAGAQDNGTNRTTTGSDDDWIELFGGDGFYPLVDPTNSSHIWVEYQYGNLYYSSNDGGSWNGATGGIPGSERRNWSTPHVHAPSAPYTRYFGTYRLWRSSTNTSWTSISPDLTDGTDDANHTITTIAVARSNSSRIYVGTSDGRVWTTGNGGANWTRIDTGLPVRWVTRVAVDPDDDQTAYVALSGYRWGETTPHLFRTTDAGASWTAIDGAGLGGPLPDAPVNAIAIDPEDGRRLFVGLDVGVYVSNDTGSTWAPFGAGLPVCVVHDLDFHESTRTLTAFTHARSTYQIAVPAVSDVVDGEADGGVGSLAGGDRLAVVGANPFVDRIEVSLRAPAGEPEGILTLVDVSGRLLAERRVSLRAGDTPASPGADGTRVSLEDADGIGRLARGTYYLRWASVDGALWASERVVRVAR